MKIFKFCIRQKLHYMKINMATNFYIPFLYFKSASCNKIKERKNSKSFQNYYIGATFSTYSLVFLSKLLAYETTQANPYVKK
jgi:hypothetical protein